MERKGVEGSEVKARLVSLASGWRPEAVLRGEGANSRYLHCLMERKTSET